MPYQCLTQTIKNTSQKISRNNILNWYFNFWRKYISRKKYQSLLRAGCFHWILATFEGYNLGLGCDRPMAQMQSTQSWVIGRWPWGPCQLRHQYVGLWALADATIGPCMGSPDVSWVHCHPREPCVRDKTPKTCMLHWQRQSLHQILIQSCWWITSVLLPQCRDPWSPTSDSASSVQRLCNWRPWLSMQATLAEQLEPLEPTSTTEWQIWWGWWWKEKNAAFIPIWKNDEGGGGQGSRSGDLSLSVLEWGQCQESTRYDAVTWNLSLVGTTHG